ncbi:2,3-dihydroxybiphenyl 1,2-dioxygenase [Acrocarpospora pleiomorpha]|uniref:2,3-dihydroxybiphenyl 1,2-dioxygenase n=1 Tax=Acrocarpospora pleiomorpha TaxID=90975 RepID=A0A5M3XXA1_9ACTN|nr:VOC family protein [Acrocarpospora pleiomorpha]GES25767.1 2,3-dihydroxybiphenyl 1,2-dioxygenase [Acrocarpospora pleiomorpha]
MTEIRGLGYLRVQTRHLDRWRSFAEDGLGFARGTGRSGDGLYLRMDEREARLIVLPGPTDEALAVGWEVRDQFALQRVSEAVVKAGIDVTDLPVEDSFQRAAEEVISFRDPGGTQVEVFYGPILDHSPVAAPFGARFVTGEQGMGHVVLPTTDMAGSLAFYTEVLGFLPRGAVRLGHRNGLDVHAQRVRFLGVNQRHHSLALVPAPHGEEPGLVHLMVEVDDLDDVGRALERVTGLGFTLSSTLGRHTNDKMISFYVRAPGGWDIEFGTAGMLVDESHYTAEEITADSYWGHDWSGSEPLEAFRPRD